jgi:predicted TIM-barrel fold metal-dependent hydrolase
MIVDFHSHVGNDKDGTTYGLDQLLESMDHNKIDYSVVFPLDEKDVGLIEASESILSQNNPKLIPFLRFNPKTENAQRLKAILHGFKGVKLHPRAQDFDPLDKKFFPLYEEIERSGKPLLVHTRLRAGNPNTDPVRISSLAPLFPGLSIVMAHFAELSDEAFKAIKKYDNLYTETSIQSETNVKIAKFTKMVGSNKVLFGSDVPYSDQGIELMKVMKAQMSDDERDDILYKNAERLLKMHL